MYNLVALLALVQSYECPSCAMYTSYLIDICNSFIGVKNMSMA